MNGAEFLARALERQGVDTIFGYPGGTIMPFYDALVDSSIRHILVRHEQAAALAADGYARATGKVGVCVSTSGPGATNLVTGIANAFLDSIPLVAITGQVPTPVMGTDAFQEVDIFGLTMPVVKHSFLVRRVEDLAQVVRDAFEVATQGRPGPVLIDLPKDVAQAVLDASPLLPGPRAPQPQPDAEEIEAACDLIAAAQRPVLYAGGGIGMAGAIEEFRHLAAASGIPVVCTLKGLGAVPTGEQRYLGMLGMHGNRAANNAVQEADLLICIGARFDDRATGKLDEFAPRAKVIHMDADASEIGKRRFADVALLGGLAPTLQALADHCQENPLDIGAWQQLCASEKQEFAWRYDAPGDGIYAPAMLRDLSAAAGDDTIITCDVGQHQMWVAQHCSFADPSRHLSSGGLGTMGFGIPSAIGAQLGNPDKRVITVTGDGSIMMNIQEFATIKRYELPVKVVLLDNQCLGMVRQWQELFFKGRYSGIDLSDNPDFTEVARSFGIPAFRVEHQQEVAAAITRLLDTDGPVLAHVVIDPQANVWPLVPPGQSNSTMIEESRT